MQQEKTRNKLLENKLLLQPCISIIISVSLFIVYVIDTI